MTFIYRGRGWCRTGPRLAGLLVEVPTHGLTAWFRYGRVGTHGWSTWPALPVFSLSCLFVLGRQGGYRRVYGLVGYGHEIIAYWGCPDILSDPVLPRFNITRSCPQAACGCRPATTMLRSWQDAHGAGRQTTGNFYPERTQRHKRKTETAP